MHNTNIQFKFQTRKVKFGLQTGECAGPSIFEFMTDVLSVAARGCERQGFTNSWILKEDS